MYGLTDVIIEQRQENTALRNTLDLLKQKCEALEGLVEALNTLLVAKDIRKSIKHNETISYPFDDLPRCETQVTLARNRVRKLQ